MNQEQFTEYMAQKKWLEDDAVKKWINGVGERTGKNYKREFPKFLEFVNKDRDVKFSPTDILNQRFEQLATSDPNKRHCWEDIWVQYKHKWENEGLRKNTIHGYIRTVQSFFAHNHGELILNKIENRIVPQNRKDIVLQTEWIPTNEDVRLFYRMAKEARDRAILLVLYQSGFNEVDLADMLIGDFPFYDKEGNWAIPLNDDLYHERLRCKTKVIFQTCISREALEDIRIMLQSRGFPKFGSLFVSFRGKPLDQRGINDAMKEIVRRAFPERVEEFLTKNLRDSYMNGLNQAKITDKVYKNMVGWTPDGAGKSYKCTVETIKTMYAEAFKFLTINGYGSQARKLEEFQKKHDEDMKQLNAKMDEDRDALMKALKDQQKKNEEFEKTFINNMASFIEKTLTKFAKKKGLDQKENYELIKEIFDYEENKHTLKEEQRKQVEDTEQS
ncbi:MAG: tyrosine-type recombinase/integrase [Candidatus Bathyarchaeia archaeon]